MDFPRRLADAHKLGAYVAMGIWKSARRTGDVVNIDVEATTGEEPTYSPKHYNPYRTQQHIRRDCLLHLSMKRQLVRSILSGRHR